MQTISYLTLLLCSVMVAIVSGDFQAFMSQHKKVYSAAEKKKREAIYNKNLEKIKLKNKLAKEHNNQVVFGAGQFSDLELEEFRNTYMGLRLHSQAAAKAKTTKTTTKKTTTTKTTKTTTKKTTTTKTTKTTTAKTTTTTAKTTTPATGSSFDWSTDSNLMLPVKNQGKCGSCWAFATTCLVEFYYARKGNTLTSFSEQMLVDCDKTSYGCNGGYSDLSLQFEVDTGAKTSAAYPYTSGSTNKAGTCKTSGSIITKIPSYATLKIKNSEDEIFKYLEANGPLSIGVAADDFQNYQNGVMGSKDCVSTDINHAVVLVGYGTSGGTNFWKIRNSWGASWGENGYIRLERGKNTCQMVTEPLYYIPF